MIYAKSADAAGIFFLRIWSRVRYNLPCLVPLPTRYLVVFLLWLVVDCFQIQLEPLNRHFKLLAYPPFWAMILY